MRSLNLRGVAKAFDGAPVLAGVDLDVATGECVALLGASGSGKSTLLRLICGLDSLDAGEIRVGDEVVSGPGRHVAAERRNVGMVFQDGALFPFLSVERNIGFGLERSERKGGPRIDEMLDLVGLSGMGGRDPATLSGGQRQRVAVARALAPSPEVLLLDEPLSNLDAALRAHLRGEIRRIISRFGVTSIIVTHDRDEAFELGDRVAVLHGGSIVAADTPVELYGSPPSAFVARATGDVSFVAVDLDDDVVVTPWGRVPLGCGASGAGPWQMIVRPEHLELVDTPGDRDAVLATVDRLIYEGSTTTVMVEMSGVGGSAVGVRHLGPPLVSVGDSVRVARRSAPAVVVAAE